MSDRSKQTRAKQDQGRFRRGVELLTALALSLATPAFAADSVKINDLVVDPAYQRPIIGKGRQNVDRIARAFSWSCFAPVVVSPVAGGKFAIFSLVAA